MQQTLEIPNYTELEMHIILYAIYIALTQILTSTLKEIPVFLKR